MFYKQPPNTTPTSMAIWVDENAYDENCDK